MTPSEIIEAAKLGEALMAILTLVVAWFGWVKLGWPKVQKTFEALSGLMAMGTKADEVLGSISRIEAMEKSVGRVEHEVRPNGQGSLRDAVTRTEATVNLMVGQMRAHADADDGTARLDCNAKGEVEWLSRALMTWTQRTTDELHGFGWISSIHPEDREDVAEEWSRCIRHRRQFDGTFQFIDRSGQPILVRMAAMPVTTRDGSGGEIVRWAATLRRQARQNDALAVPERVPQSRPQS